MFIVAHLTNAQIMTYRKLLAYRDLQELAIDVSKSRKDYRDVKEASNKFHPAEAEFQDFCYHVVADIGKNHRDDFPDEIQWWFHGRLVFLQWTPDESEKWKDS